MESRNLLKNLVAAATLAVVALVLGGCSTAESDKTTGKSEPKQTSAKEKAATPTAPGKETAQSEETPATQTATEVPKAGEQPKGPVPPKVLPLVDDMKDLQRIDFCAPAWIDKKHKELVLEGETCKAGYPLEFFATFKNRGYESVIVVDSETKPSLVHKALLAMGAKPGHPVRFDPKFEAATGTEIAIEIRWKDKDGKVQKAPAQQWVRDIKTKKALDTNWVFAGSQFRGNPETKEEYYAADGGDFISVSNVPTATLDLPIHRRQCDGSPQLRRFRREHAPRKDPRDNRLEAEVGEARGGGSGDGKLVGPSPARGQGRPRDRTRRCACRRHGKSKQGRKEEIRAEGGGRNRKRPVVLIPNPYLTPAAGRTLSISRSMANGLRM